MAEFRKAVELMDKKDKALAMGKSQRYVSRIQDSIEKVFSVIEAAGEWANFEEYVISL